MSGRKRHAADHGPSSGAAQSRSEAKPGAPRVLILGGSADGFEVAELFVTRGFDVVTSFAGRTETRRAPAGVARVGGFGGITGLAAYIAVEDFSIVIDATHPFASAIKLHAEKACYEVGAPLVHVMRAPWAPEPDDDWRFAPDTEAAATLTPLTAGNCFLTVGRMKIAPFAKRDDLSFVVRTVENASSEFVHPASVFIRDRGPFTLENERALFDRHRIDCLVTANSGGHGAAAKLAVARERGMPVVLIDRPPPPEGKVVETAAQALDEAVALIGDPLA